MYKIIFQLLVKKQPFNTLQNTARHVPILYVWENLILWTKAVRGIILYQIVYALILIFLNSIVFFIRRVVKNIINKSLSMPFELS